MNMKDAKRLLRGGPTERRTPALYDEDCELVERLDALLEEDRLSDWEIDFSESIHERVVKHRQVLTDPQRDKAESILSEKE